MRLKQHLYEAKIKSKMMNSAFGKVRIIEGYKDYKRLYVFKKKIKGQGSAYMVSKDMQTSLSSMVPINKEYWFSTLKELHRALNI